MTDDTTSHDRPSETSDDATDRATDDAGGVTEAATSRSSDAASDATRGARFRTAVNYLVLAGLSLALLVAAVQFYTSANGAIRTYVSREFRPLVFAAFNLGVALLAAAGVSIQLRRVRG